MAIKSFGTVVVVERGTINEAAVGSLTSIGLEGREASIIDVTTHSSLNNTRDFIGGLITPATLNLEGFFVIDDAGQAWIRDHMGAETPCSITFSDESGYTFDAVIQASGESAPLDEALPFTASLQITGNVTPVDPTP